MPYVERDNNDDITGTFANPQPGFAEEYLPDDDPEVVAFWKIRKTRLRHHQKMRCCSTTKTGCARWRARRR